MAEFKKVVITQKGQALMAKLMSGSGNTHFTAIKVSDSSFNDDQLEGLTSIGNVKQTIEISRVDRPNSVSAEVEGAISNTDLTVGYYMRTLGLYAQDPDEGEILYAVTIASQAGYMPPFNGKTTSGAFFRITTTIGNADNLKIQVNPSAVATIGEIVDIRSHTDFRYPTADVWNTTVDLNSDPYLDTGIYKLHNCGIKNGPFDSNQQQWFYLKTVKYDDNSIYQTIFSRISYGSTFYTRTVSKSTNQFPSWSQLATDDQVANAIASAMKQLDSGLGNRVKVLENSPFVQYQQFTNADDARLWSEKKHGLAEVIDS